MVWASGETATKIFSVPLIDDALVEGPLTVNLRLFTASTNGAIGARGLSVLTILDNDAYGTVAFSQANYEAEENGTNVAITVTRSGGIAGTGTVDYLVVDGTARRGADYRASNGTLQFLPGDSFAFSFDIEGIKADDSGKVLYSIALEVTDSAGKVRFKQEPRDQEAINALGGTSLPAGSRDTTFDTGDGADDAAFAMALQPDGELLIGGDFNSFTHGTRHRLARVNADGSLDTVFNAAQGPNRPVRAMALQDDGKLIIGGLFTRINSTNRNAIARLNSDGTLDDSFNPGAGADNPVYAIALLPDNKAVIGGSFTTFNGVPNFVP